MGFFFLPVDSPVVYKQAKKNPNTIQSTVKCTQQADSREEEDLFFL